MGEQEFWNGKERFFSDIINRVNDLLSDAYLLITNRNSHVTMIPEKTAAFFEMQAGYVKDFYQILLDHVHRQWRNAFWDRNFRMSFISV